LACVNSFESLELRGMPTYVYEGLNSGTRFEVEQRITEAPLSQNPATGEPVKRIIFASGIVFKGSGFYKNDSRAPENSSKSDAAKSDAAKSDTGKADSNKSASSNQTASADSSASKTDSTPAPSTPAATPKAASAD
jgi:predicted nucleic acid-binding Zn ribbon protein